MQKYLLQFSGVSEKIFEPFPQDATVGDIYNIAIEDVRTEEEAQEFYDRLINHLTAKGWGYDAAREIAKSNISYYSGYFTKGVRDRVEWLFRKSFAGLA